MQQQLVQQLVDQQTLEKQKHMAELMHANKGVEALGVLVQYLVFNVSTTWIFSIGASKNSNREQWNLMTAALKRIRNSQTPS